MTFILETGTINISEVSSNIYYNINDGSDTLISLWPVTIQNSNTSTTLKVLFTTDITITNIIGIIGYFECGSDNIQFGDTSLKPDGTRPIITIDNVLNYPGLIKNYDPSFFESYNNIYVYNLFVDSSGSTLDIGGGWFAQENFSRSATSYFINCSSDGDIAINGGGICGASTGIDGNLTIIGCSSSGNIGRSGGGIAGFNTSSGDGHFSILDCFSTGSIGIESGGIIGRSPGIFTLTNIIENCYSTGDISISGGGIAGSSIKNITILNCYSLGTVDIGAGGIVGPGSNNTIATNCYTIGDKIFAEVSGLGTNCYEANGNWSDSAANAALTGTPSLSPGAGTSWISLGVNQPYVLNNFGGSPYVLNNIVANNIVQTTAASLNPGDSTSAATVANYKLFRIMGGGDPTITIDSSSGIITTTSLTPPGTYNLVIYAVDDYTSTEYILIVLSPPTPLPTIIPQTIPPCCEPNVPQPNPQTSNYSADVITQKKGGKAIDSNVANFYASVGQGYRRPLSQPIFKSYYDYMSYLQGKYK
jgi:hypothetical protein